VQPVFLRRIPRFNLEESQSPYGAKPRATKRDISWPQVELPKSQSPYGAKPRATPRSRDGEAPNGHRGRNPLTGLNLVQPTGTSPNYQHVFTPKSRNPLTGLNLVQRKVGYSFLAFLQEVAIPLRG